MGETPTTQSKLEHRLFVANALINLILAVIVASYFLYVTGASKVRSNRYWRLSMLLVGVAFLVRVSLSIYDCFIPTSQMQTQLWRYFVVYYVDVAFMLIYTTAIFRVVGGWKLLSDLELQD